MTTRLVGSIKWYDDIKGFGFIEQENGKDAFVHKSALQSEHATLSEGQKVEYEVSQGPKGPQAENVRPI